MANSPFTIPNLPSSPTAEQSAQSAPDQYDFTTVANGAYGIGVVGGCVPTAHGSTTLRIDVTAGRTWDWTNGAVMFTAANVTSAAADATNPRFDLVVINNGTLAIRAGTASSNPVFPALTADDVVLCAVYIGPTVTNLTSAELVDKRCFAVGTQHSWRPDANTWVFASASTFTIAGVDLTGRFTVGTRLRFKQGGSYKYAVVVSSTFSTNTTVTIAVNTDYTIANATITDNDWSYDLAPPGYPTWFTFTSVCTGATLGTAVDRFMLQGNSCTWVHREATNGTSTATSHTYTMPITAKTITNMIWFGIGETQTTANGISQGTVFIVSAGTSASAFRDIARDAWAAANSSISNWTIIYEV